jgi:hypothetical protein
MTRPAGSSAAGNDAQPVDLPRRRSGVRILRLRTYLTPSVPRSLFAYLPGTSASAWGVDPDRTPAGGHRSDAPGPAGRLRATLWAPIRRSERGDGAGCETRKVL